MRRVVVVGHGMVGSRFVEELVGADPDVVVTVLGKEPLPAYNRVLLSSVVAGAAAVRAAAVRVRSRAEESARGSGRARARPWARACRRTGPRSAVRRRAAGSVREEVQARVWTARPAWAPGAAVQHV